MGGAASFLNPEPIADFTDVIAVGEGEILAYQLIDAIYENDGKEEILLARLREIAAEVAAVSDKASAVSPDLIAALQACGDRALAEKMAASMAPLAILGGESVSEGVAKLVRGTPLARLLEAPAANKVETPAPKK